MYQTMPLGTSKAVNVELDQHQRRLIELLEELLNIQSAKFREYARQQPEYASLQKSTKFLNFSLQLAITSTMLPPISCFAQVLCNQLKDKVKKNQPIDYQHNLEIQLLLVISQVSDNTTSWVQYSNMLKLSNSLLEMIRMAQESNVMQTYFLRKGIALQNHDAMIKQCQEYFIREHIIVIKQQHGDVQQKIIGISLKHQILMIASEQLYNEERAVLLLLHLYYQIPVEADNMELVISKFYNNRFYSELWPMRFFANEQNINAKQQSLIMQLQKEDSYELAREVFLEQKHLEVYIPTCYFQSQNKVIAEIIIKLEQIFQDIILLETNDLRIKYSKGNNIQTSFNKYYSALDYWYTLITKVYACIQKEDRIQSIKTYGENNKINTNFLLNILAHVINCDSKEKAMILEQLLLWIFQDDFQGDVNLTSNICKDIYDGQTGITRIDKQDLDLLASIIHSKAAKEAILAVNRIENRDCNEQQLLYEYNELLEFLEQEDIIIFKSQNCYGLSLMSGRIALSEPLCYDKLNTSQVRATRIITLLHEVFGHKKRKEYVHHLNVLQTSPESLRFSKAEEPESGLYIETQIFGRPVWVENEDQVKYILDHTNWLKNPDEFQNQYQSISSPLREKYEKELFEEQQQQLIQTQKDFRSFNTMMSKLTTCCYVFKQPWSK